MCHGRDRTHVLTLLGSQVKRVNRSTSRPGQSFEFHDLNGWFLRCLNFTRSKWMSFTLHPNGFDKKLPKVDADNPHVAFTLWTNSFSWESCQVFTTGITSGLRSAYYYQNIEALYIIYVLIYWYLFHVEPNLSLFHFHLTWKTCIHFSVQFTWILCLVWWNLQVLDTGKCYLSSRFHLKLISGI
jgi:hypothetical protein